MILGIGILKVASGIGGLLIRDDKAGSLSVMRYPGIRYHVTLTWMVSNKSRITLVVIRLCYVCRIVIYRGRVVHKEALLMTRSVNWH